MRLTINHTTSYEYKAPPSYALQQLRMRPQSNAAQSIVRWDIGLDGAKLQTQFADQHGNLTDLVELSRSATKFEIVVSGEIETIGTNGVTGQHALVMPIGFYTRQTKLTVPGDHVRALIDDVGAAKANDVEVLHRLSEKIREHVGYLTGATDVDTTAEDALEHGKGVCQDHTHIFLSAARSMGVPARYISGYLMMNDRVDQDASHAWAEAHIDGLGWVGFDVSNVISPDERYVQVARGLDYRGAAPTSGFIVGAEQENLLVSLQVQQQ